MADDYRSDAAGIPLRGFLVSKNKGMLIASMDELAHHFSLVDPRAAAKMTERQIERAKKQVGTSEARLAVFADVRTQVQRVFNKERVGRVTDYAAYIKKVEIDDGYGGTPTPTLAIMPPDGAKVREEPSSGRVWFPYNTAAMLVDGETQMAARYLLKEDHDDFGNRDIAFTFYASNDLNLFKAIFHDYNLLVHPVKESVTFRLNLDSPLTQAAARACDVLHKEFPKSINWTGTSMTKAKYITTRAHLIAFALGFVDGIKGLGGGEARVRRISAGLVPVDVDQLTQHYHSMMTLDRTAYPPPVICQLAGVALNANGHMPFGTALKLAAAAYDAAKLKSQKPSDWRHLAAVEVIGKAHTSSRPRAA